MKNKLLFLFVTFIFTTNVHSQGVSINNTGALADSSAILDISATDMGLLIPRIGLSDTLDNLTIPNPAHSLIIFNTSVGSGLVEGYYYNRGTAASPYWVELTPNPLNQNLNLAGNKVINLATCTDDSDAANKAYVDALFAGMGGGGAGGSNFHPGGLTTGATELSTLSAGSMSFRIAAYYCDTLTEGGHTDWYMPSFEEIIYMMVLSPSSLTDITADMIWTSTPDPSNPYYCIAGEISSPYFNSYQWNSSRKVRCVR